MRIKFLWTAISTAILHNFKSNDSMRLASKYFLPWFSTHQAVAVFKAENNNIIYEIY